MNCFKTMVIVLSLLSVASTTQPKPLSEMSDDETIAYIDALTEAKDLKQMSQLADSISALYLPGKPEEYARLMLRLCNELSTFDFRNNHQYELASDLAFKSIGVLDKVPVGNALGLVAQFRIDALTAYGAAGGDLVERRRQEVGAWLDSYARAVRDSNIPVDPNFQPTINGGITGFDDVIPGADPSAIADPKRRAAYVAALAARDQKIDQYREHVEGERLVKTYRPQFVAFLVGVYVLQPQDPTELKNELAKHAIPMGDELEISDLVAKRSNALKATTMPTAIPHR